MTIGMLTACIVYRA